MSFSTLRIVTVYLALAITWMAGTHLLSLNYETNNVVGNALSLATVLLIADFAFIGLSALILWLYVWYRDRTRATHICKLRKTLDQLAQSEADMRMIIDNLPDAFFRIDLNGHVEMASPQFAREFGYMPGDELGSRLSDLYMDAEGHDRFIRALSQAGGHLRHHSAAMRHLDGTPMWVSINAAIRYAPNGRAIGAEGIARNVTEQHMMEERLRYLAGHDALTGMCNRIRFEDRLDHAIARARRENRTLALLYLDLDGFKDVNDTYGHHKGDDTLVTIGQRMISVLRDSDTTARMGGDEFAVLLEGGVSLEAAKVVADKIISAVRQPLPGLDITVSASVGVVIYPRDGTDSDTLLRAADQTMYRAKRNGKNRFEMEAY